MTDSLASSLARLPEPDRAKVIASLRPGEIEALRWEWAFWARPTQLAPRGDDWQYWLILAGRGFGKTRTGAQWVIDKVERGGARRIALVAETTADAREVMVEGESGILACSPPWFRPRYSPSRRRLEWPNGAIATTYTAEKPDQLRGPQHDAAWIDELAKWRWGQSAWDELMLGLRLGANPQAVITTTPRPIPIIKSLVKDPLCRVTRGTTYDNRGNLAEKFLKRIIRRYEGTRLGRQELGAEILDDAPGALWAREQIENLRVSSVPEFVRVVVAVDPSVKAGTESEQDGDDGVSTASRGETGIVAAGLGTDDIVYVLGDYSLVQPTPDEWGRETIKAYNAHEADRVVGEANNGGDLVEANVRAIDRNVSFKAVHASRGKQVRAEPISSLYEQQRVRHFGMFALLEDQMCQWEPSVSLWSPNRVDALVWAITELTEGRPAKRNAYSLARARRGNLPKPRD